VVEQLGLRLEHAAMSSEMPVWDPEQGRWGTIRDRYTGGRDGLKRVIRAIVDSPFEAFDEWDDRCLQHTDDQGVIDLFEYLAFVEYLTRSWWDQSASDALSMRKLHYGERGMAGYSAWPAQGWAGMFRDLASAITSRGGEIRAAVPGGRVRASWINVAIATDEPVPILDRAELASWMHSPTHGLAGFLFEQTAYDPATAPAGTCLYVAGTIPGERAGARAVGLAAPPARVRPVDRARQQADARRPLPTGLRRAGRRRPLPGARDAPQPRRRGRPRRPRRADRGGGDPRPPPRRLRGDMALLTRGRRCRLASR
jgi:hypothetical protein